MSRQIISSGEEVVNEFFNEVYQDDTLDKKIRELLYQLYKKGKLNTKQIRKKLEEQRKDECEETHE